MFNFVGGASNSSVLVLKVTCAVKALRSLEAGADLLRPGAPLVEAVPPGSPECDCANGAGRRWGLAVWVGGGFWVLGGLPRWIFCCPPKTPYKEPYIRAEVPIPLDSQKNRVPTSCCFPMERGQELSCEKRLAPFFLFPGFLFFGGRSTKNPAFPKKGSLFFPGSLNN